MIVNADRYLLAPCLTDCAVLVGEKSDFTGLFVTRPSSFFPTRLSCNERHLLKAG